MRRTLARKTKPSRERSRARGQRKTPVTFAEDRRSLAVTVAWTMATLATLGALTLFAIAFLLFRTASAPAGQMNPLAMIPGLLLWIAIVTGSVAVGLIPLVYRFRQTNPPMAFTLAAIVIGSVPWVLLLAQALI